MDKFVAFIERPKTKSAPLTMRSAPGPRWGLYSQVPVVLY